MIFTSLKDFLEEFKIIKTSQSRMLGVDYGAKTIGIAISDRTYNIATALRQVNYKNRKDLRQFFLEICKTENICAIVLGYPINLNGEEGEACVVVQNFAKKLESWAKLPILLQDERFSSAFANKALIEGGIKRKKRNSLDDKLAASAILQLALDTIKNTQEL